MGNQESNNYGHNDYNGNNYNNGINYNINNNNNGNNGNNGNNNGNKDNHNGQKLMGFILFSLIALFFVSLFTSRFSQMSTKETSYSAFIEQLEKGNVKTVTFESSQINYTLVDDRANFEITYYTGIVHDTELVSQLKTAKTSEGKPIVVSAVVPDNTSAWILNILSFVIPLILLWVLFGFLARKMSGGMGMGVGKSTAKVYVEKSTGVTFKDVAGQDEAKEALQEVVDFLHNPKK